MNLYHDFIGLISDYLIRGIFMSVLVVWGTSFSKSTHLGYSKSILKWVMISYGTFATLNAVIIVFDELYYGVEYSGYSFSSRAFGSYWFTFWLMLVCNSLVPFILLLKKVGNKFIFLIIVSVLMNIGWVFEWFVLVVTSLHRDYTPSGLDMKGSLLPYDTKTYLLRGLILGVVVLLVGQVIARVQRDKSQTR